MLLEFSKGEAYFITTALEYYIDNLWSQKENEEDLDHEVSEVDAIEVAEKILAKFNNTQLH